MTADYYGLQASIVLGACGGQKGQMGPVPTIAANDVKPRTSAIDPKRSFIGNRPFGW